MFKKIALALFVVLAILFGCASAQSSVAASISLELYPDSSQYWIAVQPIGDGGATVQVELQESGDSNWQVMQPNTAWGFYQLAATHNGGFVMPLSFRLTSDAGEALTLADVLPSLGASEIDTNEQFSEDGHGHHTSEPTQAPTQAPTKKPATQAPTKKPATQAPTQKPATQAPTKKPASTPAPTTKPTTKPATQAPTQKPATQAPTKKPTSTGSSSSGDLCSVTSTSSEPLKIMVPLYEDPDSNWDALITAAATGVPILAIINPDDGPVSSGPDSSYKTYMQKFAAAGIQMVGYVHTLYGARSLSDVEADVSTYASKYPGLTGIFVDEAATDSSELSYYTSLYNSIKSHSGYAEVIVNPGTVPDQGYLQASTNLMIFENPASTWKSSSIPSWVTCAPSAAEQPGYKYRFSAVSYATTASQMPTLINNFAAANIGYVYASSASDVCCIYNTLTPYFSTLASTVNALN